MVIVPNHLGFCFQRDGMKIQMWSKTSEAMLHQSDPQLRDCQLLDEVKERTSQLPVATRFMIHIAQKYLYLREEQRFHFLKNYSGFGNKLGWNWKREHRHHFVFYQRNKLTKFYGESHIGFALEQQHIWKEQCRTWKEKGQPADYLMNDVPIPSNSPVLQGLESLPVSYEVVQLY